MEYADVKKMADLARIKLDAEELRALANDLERILEYADVLKEVNGEGVEEFSALAANRLRSDEASVSDTVPLLVGALPRQEHGFASVKKIIEKS